MHSVQNQTKASKTDEHILNAVKCTTESYTPRETQVRNSQWNSMNQVRPRRNNNRKVPRWADYEQNTAQNTYWKNGANQSVKSNPRLRIEAGWYVADRIRIRIEPPHAFDCRKRASRNCIRNLKNLAVRNSENTCRLSGSSIRNRIRICKAWNLSNTSKPPNWERWWF